MCKNSYNNHKSTSIIVITSQVINGFVLVLHDSEWRLVRVKLAKLETAANIFIVLITPLVFFNVGSKVRVDHADIRVVETKTDGHSTLVSLNPQTDTERERFSVHIMLDRH